MRYIKLSFKYLMKNALFVFLLSIIPAIFIGSLLSPFKFLEFINNYSKLTIVNFADIFYNVIDISWLKLLFVVLAIGLLSVVISVIVGEIDNHFRSGKHNYFNVKNYVNNNVLTIVLSFVVAIVIDFVVKLLCATIIYLFHILFAGLNASANAGCLLVAILMFAAYFCVTNIVSFILFINVPSMLLNGYTFKQSLSNTFNSVSKDFIKLLIGFLLPYLAIIPLISIFNFNSVALKITNVVCVILVIMYYSSYIMTTYYDINNLSRYDNRKYYSIK